MDLFQHQWNSLQGESKQLAEYKGQVIMIVNTASKCGLTPQYEQLQALYDEYKDQGLVILGFPCNQFLGQEPGDSEQIESFDSTYVHGVSEEVEPQSPHSFSHRRVTMHAFDI